MAQDKDADRTAPPHNIDAERALLGAVMVNNAAYGRVSSIVEAEHFMEAVHQQMWAAIVDLIETDSLASPITLKTYLGDADLGGATPMQYLARLAAEATSVMNAAEYAKIVRDLSLRRRVIALAGEVIQAASEPRVDVSAFALFDRLEGLIDGARPAAFTKKTGFRSMGMVSQEAVQAMQDEWSGKVVRRNLMTGFARLDERMGGMAPGDLIVIGGRPSMGKTALALNVAHNAALALIQAPEDQGSVVAVFSLEMEDRQLVERMLGGEAQVSGSRVRQRRFDERQMTKLVEASYTVGRLPIEIDQTAGLSISQIQTRARALHRKKRIKLLVIDYLQLIQGFLSRSKERNRSTELTEITAALKQLAKDLGCPILLLSQVGRQVEDRDDKRPMLRDLRESGSIEQDADTVLFVYREEFYVWQREPALGTARRADWESRMKEVAGVGEVVVAKQRSGKIGPLVMGYNGPMFRWENDPPDREIEPEEVRERAKREPALPANAEVLLRDIRGMILQNGRPPTDDEFEKERSKGRSLNRNARLVDRMKVFEDWKSTRMADIDDAEARKEFQSLTDKIRKTGKLAHIGDKDAGVFLWMPELAAK